MAEKLKITYATLNDSNEEIHIGYEAGLAQAFVEEGSQALAAEQYQAEVAHGIRRLAGSGGFGVAELMDELVGGSHLGNILHK